MNFREKKHRLPKAYYRGEISVAFTFCLQYRANAFIEADIVWTFVGILENVTCQTGCVVPVYCFMPDHQHMILSGKSAGADLWKSAVLYKQKTGYWLSRHLPSVSWQKDFFDHIIREDASMSTQIRYILDNPVRRGLVKSWVDHPFKGSVGCELTNVLSGIM
jgi:REP element-mobilizing transposase RayT